jgi:hypothetical protein
MSGESINTNELLARAASRVSSDPIFMASALQVYGGGRLEFGELAAALNTDKPTIVRLALCKRPRAHADQFVSDVKAIANACGIGSDKIAEVVRRADALGALRNSPKALMAAARDRVDPVDPDSTVS